MYKTPLEQIMNLLTPEVCRLCRHQDGPICDSCLYSLSEDTDSRCYKCNKITKQNKVCASCTSALRRVWWLGEYAGYLKDLIGALKYKRAREVARRLGVGIADALPHFQQQILIVPVPTASVRIRRRGYDQARLIAESVARVADHQYQTLLRRTSQVDQIGKGRRERMEQMRSSFQVKSAVSLKGANVLLIDDVLTTGATLESAARLLRDHGATHVDAAVIARHLLK